jgi:putative ABC transport system permease protein
MPLLSRIRGTLQVLFRSRQVEASLDEELQSVFELLTEEKIRRGASPQQARREAWIELEGIEQVKARVREQRHGASLDSLRQDICYSVRSLRRNPGFTITAAVTLAIGIGATTALFSALNAILLRDLPYTEPERLVAAVKTINGRLAGDVSRLDYYDFREHGLSFTDLALVTTGAGRFTITGGGQPELVTIAGASWNLFQTLDVQPIAGRSWRRQEEEQNASTVLISYGLWQRRFGGTSDTVGSTLRLDSLPFNAGQATIVGVLPRGFRFLHDADVWLLIGSDSQIDTSRDAHSCYLVGRLASGASLEQAQAEVEGIAAQLAQQYPDTNAGKGLLLIALHPFMVWQTRPSLVLLATTAGLVLLIACGNVAGLLLARGQRRLSEMAMRTALGASRRRLVHQLLTESLLLTLLAGLLGVAVAYLLQGLLLRILPAADPGVPLPAVDSTALLFALGVSIVTGLLVGIVPALQGTAINLAQRLRTGTHASEGVQNARLRSTMVIAQVALSILLLIGSGLLTRSLANLTSVQLGFEPHNVLAAGIKIQTADHSTPSQRHLFFSSLQEEIEAQPQVVSASFVSRLPIADTGTNWPIWPADQPRPANQDARLALARWVMPGYFKTMGMSLLRGRDFGDDDIAGAAPVVVITESIAGRLFPDENPIGRQVGLGWAETKFEVIGVVGNARINGLRQEYDWAMYLSAPQVDATGVGMGIAVSSMNLVVHTDRETKLLVEPLRHLVRNKDANALLVEPTDMSSIIDHDLAGFRTVLLSLSLLSAVALLLTAVGLYGVLAFQVSQRSNELGIRVAVGASPANLISLVVRQGIVLVGIGLLLGLGGAVPATRLLQQLLFRVTPLDTGTYLAAATFLVLVGLLACLLPAWRATRVNLVEVLHRD